MPKLIAKYVPIGTKIEEKPSVNLNKSLKEIEMEAQMRKSQLSPRNASLKTENSANDDGDNNVSAKTKIAEISQYGLTPPKPEVVKPLVEIEKPVIKLPELTTPPKPEKVAEELFEENFLEELEQVEIQVKHDIATKRIKLFPSNAEQNMTNITGMFDEVVAEISGTVNYEILNERKIKYSEELSKAANKLDKLEQSIDHESYHNELRLVEFEDSRLRVNRYRKRKFEGLDEIGGVAGADHKTAEKNPDINLRKNTEFPEEVQTRERTRSTEENVIRRSFVQDYEGSDLEGIDKERDKLEQAIISKQDKAKKIRGKSEEQKIAEAKERLRKKQEKRLAKRRKREKIEDVAEIDLVGNQFDVDELREERMDRLLEIKKLSAEKKEMQKQKEKQRSKATKEFYKYKKVNKKSHIVGFKQ
ncbi:hypothetical protein RZE82_04450 [Mollicutes bacterium LVI A0039]|nr:hypothetical protein RZE82_04450 [Mollicutes bacterium LVI A0039]